MRRLRNDLPYTFRAPRVQAWLRPLGLALNRAIHLSRKYRVARIETEGFQRVRELNEAGHAVLIAPNHSDHSDPHVVMELLARHGMRAWFMAAREIFEVSPAASWALQSMGVFSVDRDGPDLSAIKTAITLLETGNDPLVIFPEGEIYHHHRRLDPLNEGVSSIFTQGGVSHGQREKCLSGAGGLAVFPRGIGGSHLLRTLVEAGGPHRLDPEATDGSGRSDSPVRHRHSCTQGDRISWLR